MVTIETERLYLREWKSEDSVSFVELNADARVMEFMAKTLTQEESYAFEVRIRDHFNQHGFGYWAVETKTKPGLIGFIGLGIPRFTAHFSPCVEIGWHPSATAMYEAAIISKHLNACL